jgi:hypothetical protein
VSDPCGKRKQFLPKQLIWLDVPIPFAPPPKEKRKKKKEGKKEVGSR